VEGDRFVAMTHERATPERGAKYVEGLTERGTCVLLVELGPEERGKRVAAVHAIRTRGPEVREQSQPSRLCEETAQLAAAAVGETDRPQHSELDHETSRRVGGLSRCAN